MGNDRLDILATNQLGRALFSELYAAPTRPANFARFVFLDPRAETFYADWDRAARDTAAILRAAAGRDPHDRDLSDLVGELATQSDAFRTHWAAHNVRFHATAVKHFHHPVVGELSLSFNRLDIAADHGLTLFTYAAEPGTRSEEALNLLGSWAATIDLAESSADDRPELSPSEKPGVVPNAPRYPRSCLPCTGQCGSATPSGRARCSLRPGTSSERRSHRSCWAPSRNPNPLRRRQRSGRSASVSRRG